ncbi:hypothetical protein COY95_01920 [Candidatus Woesearchaeota archaeon CG_4_10_14_0_8_um_filter_47_5]|nr:MAG: hypothetical protein COY95_01920 [Candidatus Woesearchaeota archaeon CG_4_10_14_0_8_um_filter_47_5]
MPKPRAKKSTTSPTKTFSPQTPSSQLSVQPSVQPPGKNASDLPYYRVFIPALVLVIVFLSLYIIYDAVSEVTQTPKLTANVVDSPVVFTYLVTNPSTAPRHCYARFDIFQKGDKVKSYTHDVGILRPEEVVSGFFEVDMPPGNSTFREYQECTEP